MRSLKGAQQNARVAHWLKTLLSSCVPGLVKSHTFAAGAALFDEFNAGSFKSMSYRGFVSERNWNFPVNDLDSADRCDPNLGRGSQIEGCPPQHRPSCTHLSTRDFFCHSGIDLNYII